MLPMTGAEAERHWTTQLGRGDSPCTRVPFGCQADGLGEELEVVLLSIVATRAITEIPIGENYDACRRSQRR